MGTIITTLLVVAGIATFFAEIRRIDREKIVRALILIYLENVSPMTPSDLMFCLDTSGIKIKSSSFYRIMAKLEDQKRVEFYDTIHTLRGDDEIHGSYKERHYRLIKSPVNQKSSG